MGKYTREFDGDGSKYQYGSKSVPPARIIAARWISGCTLACWLAFSFFSTNFEGDGFAKFGSVVVAPFIVVSHSEWPVFSREPLVFQAVALLFLCAGVFVFWKGIKWGAVVLMLYFLLSV